MKKGFFRMTIGIVLKNSKKNYPKNVCNIFNKCFNTLLKCL